MRYTNSKRFVKSNLSEKSSLITVSSELERDDDDPLSMRSLSISFLGIIIASLTILLPSICILFARPLSQGNDIDNFLILKGSSSSLSNSLEIVIRETFSLNFLSTNCFEFVYFKSFTC